jgi:NADH:ubiquinone oxidoreductase subunit 2 (subunit N)
MRQLAAQVLVAAAVAAAAYLTLEFTFFDHNGEARPDFSLQTLVVVGLFTAALLALVVGLWVELRQVVRRRRRGGGSDRKPRGHPPARPAA